LVGRPLFVTGEVGNVANDDTPQFGLTSELEVVIVDFEVTDERAVDSEHAAAWVVLPRVLNMTTIPRRTTGKPTIGTVATNTNFFITPQNHFAEKWTTHSI
jgi:hypothetical protein